MTALSDGIEQVILIGDHKYEHHCFTVRFRDCAHRTDRQLRPKVNNYDLTVEKGYGFDLNRSLFERLVLKGYPHTQLKAQHRMRPEISALIRHLTYPDLIDAPKTKNRANVRGLENNVILINHDQPEDELMAAERRDMSGTSSKQNLCVLRDQELPRTSLLTCLLCRFEVQMVLKIVRYLSQQGYGTDKLVILTPYLGQLRAIMDALKKLQYSDPVLSDLDSYDLVRAGLMSEARAKSVKKQIRLATIGGPFVQ
jgi:superfamily I DNA and/or RNA helicase